MKINNYLFVFLLILMSNQTILAQVNLLKSEQHTIEGNINLINDQLSDIKSSSTATLALKNGELEIMFPTRKTTNQQFYSIQMEATLNGVPLSISEENLHGFYGPNLMALADGVKNVLWMNIIDKHQQLDGKIKVTITSELRGQLEVPIDCDNPPVFTKKQKLPYLIAGGVGVAAIGVGQLFKAKSNSTYDDDYLTAQTFAEAQPKYESANSDHQTYLILTYAGSTILVADLVMYLIRNGKHKRQMRLYKKFCNGNSLSVSPMIELPSNNASNTGASGLHFTLNF